jgi:hypothetical protein
MMQLTVPGAGVAPDPVVTRWIPSAPAELGRLLAGVTPAGPGLAVTRPFRAVPAAGLTVWRADAVLRDARGHRHRVEVDVVLWPRGFVEIDVRPAGRRRTGARRAAGLRRGTYYDLAHAAA